MPQEINKENLEARLIVMMVSNSATLDRLSYESKTARTDAHRMHIMGETHQVNMMQLQLKYTAELFGIEVD